MIVSMEMLSHILSIPATRIQRGEDWNELGLRGWALGAGDAHTLSIISAETVNKEIKLPDGPVLIAGMPDNLTKSKWSILTFSCGTEVLTNAVNTLFTELNGLEKELMRAAYSERSIQRLTDLMGRLFEGRLAVLTADMRVLSICERDIRADELSRSLSEELTAVEGTEELLRIRTGSEPYILENAAFGKDCLCVNVFHQGIPVCILVHYEAESDRPQYYSDLLQTLRGYIQAIYEAAGEARDLPSDRLHEIAEELLSGGTPRRESVELALQFRGWPADGPFMCVEILPSKGDSFNRTLSYYCRAIGREIPNTYTMENQGRILCVVFMKPFGNTLEGFMEQNVEFLRDSNLLAGFSNLFMDFMELPAACRQAEIALRMGMRERPTFWYHRFSEMVMPYLLDCMTGELKAEDLCAPQLQRLYRYDEKNGTEYTRTLDHYLRNALNAAGTAKELYIHRGTMNYRLSRIREITGLDPEDPDIRLYLELSLKLLRHRKAAEQLPANE